MTARGSRCGCVSSPWYVFFVFIFLLTFSHCVRPPPSPHTPALVVTMATPYFFNSLFIFLLTMRRPPTATNDDPRENSGIFLILFFCSTNIYLPLHYLYDDEDEWPPHHTNTKTKNGDSRRDASRARTCTSSSWYVHLFLLI